mgnify:CR=1 FL=1
MEKKQFKAESQRLMDLMINSIYTHKEIFLRELISNASDAIDKLYFRSLTDSTVKISKDDYRIFIKADKQNRTLTISDNGCGMEKEKCDSILNEESNHYGINNIHKRIQLLYGKEYGLTLQSTPNFGTSVTIRLKADTN